MRLADFFATVAPFLEGRGTHEAAAVALYPEAPQGTDARRLRLYGHFCRVHRHEALDKVYEATRGAVLAMAGAPAWDALVAGYFAAHPMDDWELNANGRRLPAYLAQQPDEPSQRAHALAPWLHELADLEWWEWQTLIAPEDAADAQPDVGPLRLASTVELRAYEHMLLDHVDEGAPTPPQGRCLVLFWRDGELDLRREAASPDDLQVLKLVSEGRAVPASLRATLLDLHEAGVVHGRVSPGSAQG